MKTYQHTQFIEDFKTLFNFLQSAISIFSEIKKKPIAWKVDKNLLVQIYQVDKKTFNKWVEFFCPDSCPDFTSYQKQRKLTAHQFFAIVEELGDTEECPVLSKIEIIEKAEGSYRSLRESVHSYPSRFGLSPIVYAKLHKFPPNVGQKILDQYN